MVNLTEKIKKGYDVVKREVMPYVAMGVIALTPACGGSSDSGSSAPPNDPPVDPPTEITYSANPTANTIYARGDTGNLFGYKMEKKGTVDTFDITASDGSKLESLLIGDSGKTLPITNTTGNTYKVGTLSLSDLDNGTYSLKTPSGKEIGYTLKKGVLDNGDACGKDTNGNFMNAVENPQDYVNGIKGNFNYCQKSSTCGEGQIPLDVNNDEVIDSCN